MEMDIQSYFRWYDYSRARDMMFKYTDSEHAPWHIVHSDDKKRARLNVIAHILSRIPYEKVKHAKVKLPALMTIALCARPLSQDDGHVAASPMRRA